MELTLLFENLLSPPILFFLLGMSAALVRSDLQVPDPLPKLFALYLLWAIGFKGGVSLRASGLEISAIIPLAIAVVFSAAMPVLAYPLLRRRFTTADACATAAAYGSVSVVTFIAAVNFLEARHIGYSGSMVAALALMESPAIVVAVMIHRMVTHQRETTTGFVELLREAFCSGPVFLLLGSLVIGTLTGERGWSTLRPFCEDIFHGVLVLFLLESGLRASSRLRHLRMAGPFAMSMGIVIPLMNAVVSILVAWAIRLPVGDAFLLTILSASASYIAVPAAMRMAIPKANPSIYLPMALAITFPFNIALGIPLYLSVIRALWGD